MKLFLRLSVTLFVILSLSFSPGKTSAQGTGNHVTMSVTNCQYFWDTLQTIQFDLMITSDGTSTSDLRLSSCQYGINFDTTVLQTGAPIFMQYVMGSSQFIPPLSNFNFPTSTFRNHIRIVESAYAGGNTGVTMVVGTPYRVGTFRMGSYFVGGNPNFSLQSTVAGGKTVCAAIINIDTASVTTSFTVTGTGDGQRSVSVTSCSLITGLNNASDEAQVEINPNPIKDHFTVTGLPSAGATTIEIYNILGKKVYTENTIAGRKPETINCKLLAGMYFVRINNGGKQYLRKVVVQ